MMQRRALLGGALAALAAPAIVRPGLIMRLSTLLWRPGLVSSSERYGVGFVDDRFLADCEPYAVKVWGFDAFNRLTCEEIVVGPSKPMNFQTAWKEIHGIELSSDRPDRGWSISHS